VKTHPAKTTYCYSYLRYSSPAQAEGDTVRRQTALRDAWLKRHPGVVLDTSVALVDAGVSGYTGANRTNKKHALASFLDLVERGRVPVGSYLIVENLDRLTREKPTVAIPAVMNLINAGVQVVQLEPVEIVYNADMEQHQLMYMLWELARGHGESKRKSGLLACAWGEKKAQARNGVPHGRKVPAWLVLEDGRYRLIPEAAEAVRLIYRWCREGLGVLTITQRLRDEGIPPITPGGVWVRGYVAKILGDRAVLGEYQPMKGHKKRTPDGDPIPNYWPAVVTEEEFYAAQTAIKSRAGRCGRPPREEHKTLFAGLLRSARDGKKLHVRTRPHVRYLFSSGAADGEKGADREWFPLDVFEAALLSMLKELQASALFADPGAAEVAELDGRLGEVERRLAAALERFEADPESPTWADRVSQYDRQKRALVQQLAEARQKALCPASAAWSEAVSLMALQEPDRLRAALLATVKGVWCLFVARGYRDKLAAVQVCFEGGARRDYLILHRPPVTNAKPPRPGTWRAKSLATAGIAGDDDLDLRDRRQAAALAGVLGSADLAQLWEKLAP
jgi:DNA invertase Pin-like site-specific DNA recombinase